MDRLSLACFDWALDRGYSVEIPGHPSFGTLFAYAIIAVVCFAAGHVWATDGIPYYRRKRKQ